MPPPTSAPPSPAILDADDIPHMVWVAGPDGDATYHNRCILEYAGLPPGLILDSGWERLLHPDDVRATRATWSHAVETCEPLETEYRLRRRDGAFRWFLARATAQRDDRGRVIRWVGTCTDIENQKEAAARGLARMRAVAESMADGLVYADRDGRLLDWNPAALRMHGFASVAEARRHLAEFADTFAVARPDGSLLPCADWPMARVLRGETVTHEKLLLRRPDIGSELVVIFNGAPVRGPGGDIELGVVTLHDVTRRKQAEGEARRTAKLLKAVAEETTDAVFVKDRDGKYLVFNETAGRLVGKSPEEVIGRDDTAVFDTASARVVMDNDRRVVASGVTETKEEELTAAGVTRIYLATKAPYRDEHGNVAGVIGISRDITARKRAQDALTLFRSLIDRTNEAFEVIDPDTGRFLDVNEKACRARGYTREEYLALRVPDVDPTLSAPGAWAQHVEYIRTTGSRIFEGQHRRRDGSVFPVEINVTYICLDRDYLLAVVRDITERKRAEEELSRSERLLRQVLNALPTGVAVTDLSGDILLSNPASKRIWGGIITPGAERRANSKGWWRGTGKRIGPDEWASRRAATAGQTSVNEIIDIETFDGIRKVIKNSASPIQDDALAITGVIIINEDVTDVLRLEDQFRQAQKMDAFGQLAGGVAHDFNNLLTIINGYSDLLLGSLPPGDPNRELLAEIHKAGERSAGLTRQLLAFSRQQVLAPRVLDLNAVVADTASMLRRMIGEDVTLSTAPAPTLWPVMADPGQVEQILLNLAVNARDAMPTGGKLTIETRNIELDETYAASHPDARPGPHVLLSVSDTGHGMTPEVRAKIFEPFFTTKAPGKGTGLGLATVYGIVRQSGGYVAVDSEGGRGTTFKVYLPRTDQAAGGSKTHSALRIPPRGTETVLLVEDEDAVRALIRHILRQAGYTVLEAAGGDEALRVAAGHAGTVHLLVTDVVMPGLGGRVAAERLTERHPGLRVLFVSGYTNDAVVRHGVLHDKVNFLQKPFTPAGLAQKVREVLDAPPG
ncbi:MAG: Blue-light-activated protein [Gemmataceae bacterium]|nr:Blue-light-activated protein [Gemmataceae bacterium]